MGEDKGTGLGGLLQVIWEPQTVFEKVVEKPRFWLPAFVLVGLNLLLTIVTIPKIKEITLWSLENMSRLNPEADLEQIQALSTTMAEVGALIGALLAPFLTWLIVAALVKLFSQFMAVEREGKIRELFAVSVFAWVPSLIGIAVKNILMLLSPVEKVMQISTGLSLFFSMETMPFWLYSLLAKFDFFTVWNMILLSIGTGVVFKISGKRGAGLVFGLFVAYLFLTAALTYAFGSKAPVIPQ